MQIILKNYQISLRSLRERRAGQQSHKNTIAPHPLKIVARVSASKLLFGKMIIIHRASLQLNKRK